MRLKVLFEYIRIRLQAYNSRVMASNQSWLWGMSLSKTFSFTLLYPIQLINGWILRVNLAIGCHTVIWTSTCLVNIIIFLIPFHIDQVVINQKVSMTKQLGLCAKAPSVIRLFLKNHQTVFRTHLDEPPDIRLIWKNHLAGSSKTTIQNQIKDIWILQ